MICLNTLKTGLHNASSKLEKVFVKHYASNHMPDPKRQ